MAFAYGQLILFLHNPGPVHMAAAERALAYVRGTRTYATAAERALAYVRGTRTYHDQGLSYCDPGAENRNVLTGWVDSDFAADSDTRRSVTGYVMALNGATISWRSCRQEGVTLSSSEAEYVAASAIAQENAYRPGERLPPRSSIMLRPLPSWSHMRLGRQCCMYSYE